jgi:arginine deiminase
MPRPEGQIAWGQEHENDRAQMVVVCAPSISKSMGALHPAGALYARPVHIDQARDAHASFVAILRRRGVETHDVREILGRDADWNVGERVKLEKLAASRLTYQLVGGLVDDVDDKTKYYVSDEYKTSVLAEMDVNQLVDIVLTNPTVTVSNTQRDTGCIAEYSFSPLTNIVFTRDQQVTTAKGVVFCRLRSAQRQREVEVLEFCMRKQGVNVLGRVAEGYLEGGDFFPCGREMCFVGVGPRSDTRAVHWMMKADLFGTERVVVVRDEIDKHQDRMHLDCVFSIVGQRCCLLFDGIVQKVPSLRRTVDMYKRTDDNSSSSLGSYAFVESESKVEFVDFLTSHDFQVISISANEQLRYGCNVLNLGDGALISSERQSARKIATHPAFKGTVEYLDFSPVTAMYGGLHCSSQVVSRKSHVLNDEYVK